jgi:hypothetical protein
MPAKLRFHHLVPLLAAATALGSLLVLIGIVALQRWLPATLWHMVFAVAAMPMIFAAMTYFTPVLTRSPEPPLKLAALPLLASLAGMGIVTWFAYGVETLRHASPWLALFPALALLGWMLRRWRACMGSPHAGLRWYVAAIGCLSLGLLAIGVSDVFPEHAQALRAFHLHINTLGFMGLTAIGTLQVLLPTVVSQPDPAAAKRLARDLPWSVAGTLAIAIGAAWSWPLAMAGSLAYLWPLWQMLQAALAAFRNRLWSVGQPSPLLLAAAGGMILLIAHGVMHSADLFRARGALPLFLIAFLLPLVSGAVAQLLPVWLRPGSPSEVHKSQRRRLAAFARTRAVLLASGGTAAAFGIEVGYLAGMLGAIWLVIVMAITFKECVRTPRPTP